MSKKQKFIDWLRRAPKASHTIRVLAGAYLLYTAYQIFSELNKGQNDFLIIAFAVLFSVIGAALLAASLYALSNYYYAENTSYGKEDDDEEGSGEDEGAEEEAAAADASQAESRESE